MKCAEFGKKLELDQKRDKKKPIDNSLRAQALKRASDSDVQVDLSDPWVHANTVSRESKDS